MRQENSEKKFCLVFMLSAPCLTLVILPSIHCRLVSFSSAAEDKMPVDRVSCFIFIIWAIDTSKNAYAANADVQENSGIL